jgi:hypothetical protein
VGTSNPAIDWNYDQTAYDAATTEWPWNINFNLASVPASGNATLTLAWAASGYASIKVFVNDPSMVNLPLTEFYPIVGGGNVLILECLHGKYGVNYVSIPVSLLRTGANTISLYKRATGSTSGPTSYAMYDYLNLEMPGAPTPDFSVSATPTSQTVAPGASAPYTVTVSPSGGFTGTVTFSANGLPSGATATFNPTSVATSGSTTMTVATSTTTPAGSYPLTVTATSGTLVHTVGVTLVVRAPGGGDFMVAATPSSSTVVAGAATSYTVTVTATAGFTGTVTFSVSGLPTGAVGSFNPTSVAGAGTSTLSVTTDVATPAGSYPLTITGTSGSLVRSASVTLVVTACDGSC